jgi:hypothetical protein
MTAQEKIQRGYMVSTRGTGDAGLYRVSYVPRGVQQARTSGRPKKAPGYAAAVNVPDESVTWENQPADPEAAVEDFKADALRRAKAIHGWLTMLTSLIGSVEAWTKKLGWSSRRIEKPMEDSEVGKYVAPALLLQEETTKVLLEPITRSAPGAEGVVDLYLMPGYDDIASLYYYKNRWNLHYMSAERRAVANIREAESKPLTEANLKRVLEEMKANAQ